MEQIRLDEAINMQMTSYLFDMDNKQLLLIFENNFYILLSSDCSNCSLSEFNKLGYDDVNYLFNSDQLRAIGFDIDD